MHFGLTEEQAQLREIARAFLATDPSWETIVEEQGWQAIAVPEAHGGFGFGWMELAVIFEELGRSLTETPLLGTACATAACLRDGRLLDAIAAGETATLVTGVVCVDDVLTGTVVAPRGQHVVVETTSGLFLAEPAGREPVVALDPSRPLERLVFSGSGQRLEADRREVLARSAALLAAESVGAAEKTLEMAVDYLQVRQQFGKVIGSFQALKHMAADMFVAVESARSATWYACWALDAGHADALEAAHTAKALATEALFHCAGQNIQLHGGIGFTLEHDAHRYFKRAQANLVWLGHPREHRAAVATALLGAP